MKFKIGVALSLITASVLMGETYELGKIEVTSEKDISQNPSVEVVSTETIKESEAKTVVDALQSVPSVYSDYTGARGESKVRVRGFSSTRVPIYIDGIPIYVPYDHNIDLARFKTYDIGEIDVSKGYVSPMYGANTMGGAINLITKKPTKELEGEVGAGVFSGNGYEEYATIGTKQEIYYGLLSVSNMQRDYYKLPSDYDSAGHQEGRKRSNSEYGDKKINIKVGYTPNSTDEYSLNYIAQRGEKEQPWFAMAQGTTTNNAYNRNWDWKDWDKTSYYLITKTAIGEHYLKTRLYYDEFYNKILFKGTPQSGAQDVVSEISEYDDHTFGGIIEGDIKIADNHLLKLSVSQKYDNHKDISSKSPNADLKDESKTLSLGAEYSWQLTDALTWTLGGSYDKNEITKAEYRNSAGTLIAGEFPKYDSDAFNPQTILTFHATKDLMFYGSVSQKSNMPTLKDRYSSKFGDYILNPSLDAERSTTYEVGSDWAFVDDHHAKVALFYTKTKDYIASVSGLTNTDATLGCTGTNCKQMQNFDQEEHKGVELTLDSLWSNQLKSTLSYTYIDAEIEDSKTANAQYTTDTPKHSYYASMTYSPIHSVDITPIIRHEGERYSNVSGSEKSSSYTVADIRVAYRPVKALELAVGIKNLFDEFYYYNNGYPQEGRNYYANVRYSF
ncbi:TonB-dependent receptor plug domain-containing protein [Sulfurospirillum multivorans]|uniref:TonB-dependent receptor n=2 Tax=Sulfurospirillum multivorans TaxID=66821 RepID=A0AA86E0S6_SULMK|nr:TonB-dependent receptor [Sulfurospirillum multivorans]AHJ14115.1 TonB-dependent receptor [Sulfurospirillum multivorans DSM 12446]QEH07600.1 TonB-dependent receptor [Sulfurospirillum multivorans]